MNGLNQSRQDLASATRGCWLHHRGHLVWCPPGWSHEAAVEYVRRRASAPRPTAGYDDPTGDDVCADAPGAAEYLRGGQ